MRAQCPCVAHVYKKLSNKQSFVALKINYTFASANSPSWTQETISLVQKMPRAAFAAGGLAFFCSGVFKHYG